MNKPRECGCKGCRSCKLCEDEYHILPKSDTETNSKRKYVYCPYCNKAWEGSEVCLYKQHPNHEGNSLEFPGIYIELEFLNLEEEDKLIKGIDEMPWDLSQSGRRKQNFGPKCNFKKQKIKLGNFKGFPFFTKFVQDKFKNVNILNEFKTIEQCSLEYNPMRGASIDPHIDDCWIWGERIVTVNLLSDSVLRMRPFKGESLRYNLHCIENYSPILNSKGQFIKQNETTYCIENNSLGLEVEVLIPMPKRSLLVIYGPARYFWEHFINRDDIQERRVCLAYREFTPPYLENGIHSEIGEEILNQASFW